MIVPARDQSGSIALPDGYEPPAGQLDRSLVLGIRPEHVRVLGDGAGRGASATVQVVESLGNETLLYFQLGGEAFTARSPGQLDAQVDQDLNLAFAAEHIHLFAPDGQGPAL